MLWLSLAQHQAFQLALVAPLPYQVVEHVEARHVGIADGRADALAPSAALIVVITWRAGNREFRGVYRSFADRLDPIVLSFLARLDGRRAARHCFGNNVSDVFGLLLEHRGGVSRHAALDEAGEELIGEAPAGHAMERFVAVAPVIEE